MCQARWSWPNRSTGTGKICQRLYLTLQGSARSILNQTLAQRRSIIPCDRWAGPCPTPYTARTSRNRDTRHIRKSASVETDASSPGARRCRRTYCIDPCPCRRDRPWDPPPSQLSTPLGASIMRLRKVVRQSLRNKTLRPRWLSTLSRAIASNM